MQAYGSQSSASAYMPSTGFYNGSSSQSPYGVLSPATYTTMGVAGHTAGTRALSQQCKNGQSLGIISTPKMADANRPITFLLSNTAQTPPYLSSYGSAFGSVGTKIQPCVLRTLPTKEFANVTGLKISLDVKRINCSSRSTCCPRLRARWRPVR